MTPVGVANSCFIKLIKIKNIQNDKRKEKKRDKNA
jgi:hypothetical protein